MCEVRAAPLNTLPLCDTGDKWLTCSMCRRIIPHELWDKGSLGWTTRIIISVERTVEDATRIVLNPRGAQLRAVFLLGLDVYPLGLLSQMVVFHVSRVLQIPYDQAWLPQLYRVGIPRVAKLANCDY